MSYDYSDKSKNVKILFRYENGKFKLIDGTRPFPAIKEGAVGDILISDSYLDPEEAAYFKASKSIVLFEPDTHLIVSMSSKSALSVSSEYRDILQKIPYEILNRSTDKCFIKIRLRSQLILHTRGSRFAYLEDVSVELPKPFKIVANSLNHAFTILSEKYESHRRTHTGNSFKDFYFMDIDEKYYPLEKLRHDHEF